MDKTKILNPGRMMCSHKHVGTKSQWSLRTALHLVLSLEFSHRTWAFLVKQISGVKSLKTSRFEPIPSAQPKPSECTGTELSFSEPSVVDGWVSVGTMCCPWPAGDSGRWHRPSSVWKALISLHGRRLTEFPWITEIFGQTSVLI